MIIFQVKRNFYFFDAFMCWQMGTKCFNICLVKKLSNKKHEQQHRQQKKQQEQQPTKKNSQERKEVKIKSNYILTRHKFIFIHMGMTDNQK